jgi:hypothetical protein
MTIDPRERLQRIDPAPPDVAPPSGAIEAVAVIHEIERRMGMSTRDTTNNTDTPIGEIEQTEPGLAGMASNTTPAKQAGKRRWSGALVAAAAFGVVIVVGAAFLLASRVGEDQAPAATPAAGPIAFQTVVDLSHAPISGTFEVMTGADVLGCSSGTLVRRSPSSSDKGDYDMTCESGAVGTFTIVHGGDRFEWSVLESSDDFAGLQGEGRFTFVLTSSSTVVETFTGDIEYTP